MPNKIYLNVKEGSPYDPVILPKGGIMMYNGVLYIGLGDGRLWRCPHDDPQEPGTIYHTYECTGTDDNIEISRLVNTFMNTPGSADESILELSIRGTLGVSGPLRHGDIKNGENLPYLYTYFDIHADEQTEKRAVLNFGFCNIPDGTFPAPEGRYEDISSDNSGLYYRDPVPFSIFRLSSAHRSNRNARVEIAGLRCSSEIPLLYTAADGGLDVTLSYVSFKYRYRGARGLNPAAVIFDSPANWILLMKRCNIDTNGYVLAPHWSFADASGVLPVVGLDYNQFTVRHEGALLQDGDEASVRDWWRHQLPSQDVPVVTRGITQLLEYGNTVTHIK